MTVSLEEMEARDAELEREIARIDAGGDAWEGTEPLAEELTFKQPLDKVVAVRLSDAQWQQLYAEARELGVGPTTLMRMWTLEKLRALRQRRQSA
jgi:hypothetical protein